MTNTQGLDYAGGRPSGSDIAAAGYGFVVRYLTPGGSSLPGKQLLPSELADLQANGIDIVANWEVSADAALNGEAQGVADAQAAAAYVQYLGGPADRPIYFSVDFDEAPSQQDAITAYFQGVNSVIGVQNTGIYGGYWPISRCFDAGVVTWAWQTQGWSGGNVDPRINILQNNNAGYIYLDGVPCDLDESQTDDFGQWSLSGGFDMAGVDAGRLNQAVDRILGVVLNRDPIQGIDPSATPFDKAGVADANDVRALANGQEQILQAIAGLPAAIAAAIKAQS